MKKFVITFSVIILSIVTVFLSFNYKQQQVPNTYYKVYLKGNEIGVIESKKKLEEYIDKQNAMYKEKYNVKNVYAPNGLEINKISTYSSKVDEIEDIYEQIINKDEFTIPGVEFNLKKDNKQTTIYVTDKKVFDEAINATMKTFVGVDNYLLYEEEQKIVDQTGKIIENISIQENVTTKNVNIPINEKIYNDATELSKFFVFGENKQTSTYEVKMGDNIEDVAFNNNISVEEFLISNSNFTSEKNMLFPGQEVTIAITDPQISVQSNEYVIEDKEIKYQTNYQYDKTASVGNDKVVQTGENGMVRTSQNITYVNGNIYNVETLSREELKPTINEIIIKGEKKNDGVGSKTNWLWPTNYPYRIMSGYENRINPITKVREVHQALDISGVGEGSPIYAVTNGTVYESRIRREDGNYVCLNHNNGYYTCYAHMVRRNVSEGQIVSRGDVIGFVGHTGYATGPHVHFEVWIGKPYMGGYRINPYGMYR